MKILLPVDGSELSLQAVRMAIALLGQGLSGSVVVANVQEPATLYEMVVAPDGAVLQRVSTAAGIDALQQAEALLMAANVVYEREIATGDPANTINHYATVPQNWVNELGVRCSSTIQVPTSGDDLYFGKVPNPPQAV